MIAELFYSKTFLQFKTLLLNSCIVDVFDNLSVIGEVKEMKHCCDFISQHPPYCVQIGCDSSQTAQVCDKHIHCNSLTTYLYI